MSALISPDTGLPITPSPFEGRALTVFDHLRLSAYWFGSNFLWGAFLGSLLAAQVERMAAHSAGALSQLYAIAAIPAILIPLVSGPLSDRCKSALGRRRPYIGVGGLLTILGLVGMALAYSRETLLGYTIGYLLVQLGSNIALGAYSGVIPDQVPHDQHGRASGFMALMTQMGTLFGAIVIGFAFGHRAMGLVAMAAVYGVFLLYTMLTLKEEPLRAELPPLKLVPYLKSLWIDPRQYPDFAWVWLTRALMMIGFYMIQPFLLYYLRDVVGLDNPEHQFPFVLGMILIAATISGFIGGAISDKIGRKNVVIGSTTIIAIMCFVFIFVRNINEALIAGLLFGVGYGAYISVDWALGTDVLPSDADAGKDMAVWHISMTLPQQIGPAIAGTVILQRFAGPMILDHGKQIATYQLPGYVILFAVSACCFLLSGLLVRKVKKVT